ERADPDSEADQVSRNHQGLSEGLRAQPYFRFSPSAALAVVGHFVGPAAPFVRLARNNDILETSRASCGGGSLIPSRSIFNGIIALAVAVVPMTQLAQPAKIV